MKYKVGDKVRVRTDLIVNNDYGDDYVCFTSGMNDYAGQVVTISEVRNGFYKIKEDSPFRWSWVDEMFEDVSDDENKTRIVNVADNSKAFHDAFVEMIDFAKEHLTKEQFNEFIYTVYTRGIENAPITESPVYENIEYDGRVLWKRIKGVEYKVECKNFEDDKIKDYEIRGTKGMR